MLTFLMVLSLWTGLAVLTAAGLSLVFAGARHLELQHAAHRRTKVPAPASAAPSSLDVPRARASSDQVVPASA